MLEKHNVTKKMYLYIFIFIEKLLNNINYKLIKF